MVPLLHKYEILVLEVLKRLHTASLERLCAESGLGKDEAMWALQNLSDAGIVELRHQERERITISDEGVEYAKHGLPEEQLLKELDGKQIKVSSLGEKERIGLQWSKKLGLVDIQNGELRMTDKGKAAANKGFDSARALKEIYEGKGGTAHKSILEELSRRKLIEVERRREVSEVAITQKGKAAEMKASESIDQVDRGVIANESWKSMGFKSYDVNVKVERRVPALKHPLKRLIDRIKDAYVSMGYQEVSGPAVESSFWVFDSLFVPQDHPARDAQDTFYISNLDRAELSKIPHVRTVRKAHVKGWHAKWKEDVARQMLLRTHTTSVSSRYVYNIVNGLKTDPDKYTLPIKLFSVGRVFRNETVDYRHLADFYQHDGVIIGKDLTLSNLFDELTKIYAFLGIKIKFKPSYFPFVEPGVEYFAYHEERKEWIEVGGAGMFREEITGVKRSKLSVLAWGPGIDRTLLIKDSSISNISELYNNGIGWLRSRREV